MRNRCESGIDDVPNHTRYSYLNQLLTMESLRNLVDELPDNLSSENVMQRIWLIEQD
jgi:hypothetical protein